MAPVWQEGDSRNLAQRRAGNEFRFLLSHNPADLSTMNYEEFVAAYRQIIHHAVALLKPNQFACFVVGEVRDPKGFYRHFVGATIEAFESAGALLYNEAILPTQAGSLPIRVTKQFQAGRKLDKTHQNVLVFYKGDPKQIRATYGDVAITVGEAKLQ